MTFIVTCPYTWVERNVIPPRCRTPRDIAHPGQQYAVEVPTVTADEAPVAMRERAASWDAEEWRELRWWGGRLWDKYRPWAGQSEDTPAGSKYFPALLASFSFSRSQFYSHEEAGQAFREWADGFLIVDGVVYERAGEPRYEVATFGFGSNHGGTALMTSRACNSNIPRKYYFTALQFEQARRGAVAVAVRRGDTESAERIRAQEPEIQVLIPQAQTLRIPTTYRVRVQYTEEAVLEIDAESEERACADARSRVNDGDDVRARRTWAQVSLLPARTRITHIERARLDDQDE